jgi:hypothetical protein
MNPIKKIIFSLLIIFNSATVFATEQFPDLVIYNCDTFYISGTLDKEFPLYEILNNETYKSKFNLNEGCESTGCNRGYRATWIIEKGEIYLKEIKYCCSDNQYDLKKIFGEKVEKKGVKAFWINRNLNISSKPINIFTLREEINIVELKIKGGKLLKDK